MAHDRSSRVFVAGHRGMVGSAIVRRLEALGYDDILTASHEELDLEDQRSVREFFRSNKIDEVYLAAAKVGGINANWSEPAEFITKNLLIETNVISAAHDFGIQRLLQLGSSCIYPKFAEQPIREDSLLTGTLEETNEPYAVAKIAGIKLAESFNRQYGRDYRSVMPTNLYGQGDNYDPEKSHVLPALLRRFHDAVRREEDQVVVWGSGTPRREFMHVDDMASASVFVMELDEATYREHTTPLLSHINVGTGSDVTIRELAERIAELTGFHGRLVFDSSKPDGTPRKLLDVTRLAALGWTSQIPLHEGLPDAYQWFLAHQDSYRGR